MREAIAYYNKETDNLYVKLKNAKTEHTISWDDGRFYIDFDKKNQPIGIEIVGFLENFPAESIKKEQIKEALFNIKSANVSIVSSSNYIYFKYYLSLAGEPFAGEKAIPIQASVIAK
jgi:uncharacterized protein YuzE